MLALNDMHHVLLDLNDAEAVADYTAELGRGGLTQSTALKSREALERRLHRNNLRIPMVEVNPPASLPLNQFRFDFTMVGIDQIIWKRHTMERLAGSVSSRGIYDIYW